MKTCSKCDISKPLSGFSTYLTRRKEVKPKGLCRACVSTYQRKRYAEGLDPYCSIRERGYRLKKQYGMTLEDYAIMSEQQDNKCSICLTPTKTNVSLCVDHNHDTGEVRGLLCQPCNSGIGFLKDDPTILARAINYLLEKGDYSQL